MTWNFELFQGVFIFWSYSVEKNRKNMVFVYWNTIFITNDLKWFHWFRLRYYLIYFWKNQGCFRKIQRGINAPQGWKTNFQRKKALIQRCKKALKRRWSTLEFSTYSETTLFSFDKLWDFNPCGNLSRKEKLERIWFWKFQIMTTLLQPFS